MADTSDSLLAEARQKLASIDDLCRREDFYARYPLNPWWDYNSGDLAEIVEAAADPTDAIRRAQERIHFSALTTYDSSERIARHAAWMAESLASNGFGLDMLPREVGESPMSRPENSVDFEGRRVSPDLLRFIDIWATLSAHTEVPDTAPRVLELGSGYGGFARATKLMRPGAKLTLVDLPISLFFAFLFLKVNFPSAKIVFATDAKEVRTADADADFLLAAPIFADALRGRHFDLFVNTNSMTEMTNEVISFWFDFLETGIDLRYLYLDNRFLNRCEEGDHRRGENACFGSIRPIWNMVYWQFDPPATRSPYISTLHPKALRLIAERLHEPPDEDDLARRSLQLFEPLMYEDWFAESLGRSPDGGLTFEVSRYLNQWPRTLGVHTFDGSTGGTLFKLWESVRLHPTQLNVQAMRAYLRFLRESMPANFVIEEESYYADLAERLT